MTTYKYADGNGNVFIISATTLEYQPVKAAESSSGVYSGGEPKTISLTSDQYSAIRAAFEKAIANTVNHIPARIKMSGAITATDQKNYFLSPGCDEMKELEYLLRQHL